MDEPSSSPNLIELPESSRDLAWQRFQSLRPHIEDGVPLAQIALQAEIPFRTAQRWVAAYKKSGLVGLVRRSRQDCGGHRVLSDETKTLIEGLALQKSKMSAAAIHRKVTQWCEGSGVQAPSYSTVYGIIRRLQPALVTLAHEGTKSYRRAFDLLHRYSASEPNEIWQADHVLLDIWLKDENERPVRPWLTVILDDYSRAVSGYYLSFCAPSAQQTALALKQGIWRKSEPSWHICGIPGTLYTDHGSDFTSHHIEQVCLDLKIQLIFSAVGQPRGRGKIERFFRTVNQLLLVHLEGYISSGERTPTPNLTLKEFEQEFARFLMVYHQTPHSQTGEAPQKRWDAQGFLPQLPDSLEQLALLLLTIKKTRRVHRDGIRFQGLRYTESLLANYIGEEVNIRYDPRDMAELRVYHQNRFLCRAICPDLSTETVSLKDIQTARKQRRKELKQQIKVRSSLVDALLGSPKKEQAFSLPKDTPKVMQTKTLKRYEND